MAGPTIKQEAFCRAYVETGNASEAYRRAYSAGKMKRETIAVKACELLRNGKITVRLAELQAELQGRHNVTVDALTLELEADRQLARGNNQAGAAVTATMAIARLHGLADRTPPIKFPLPEIIGAATALAAQSAVIEGLTTGRLAPDEAKAVSSQIEQYRRTLETEELETRIREIERRLGNEE
jgi:phage terminase small subunit